MFSGPYSLGTGLGNVDFLLRLTLFCGPRSLEKGSQTPSESGPVFGPFFCGLWQILGLIGSQIRVFSQQTKTQKNGTKHIPFLGLCLAHSGVVYFSFVRGFSGLASLPQESIDFLFVFYNIWWASAC